MYKVKPSDLKGDIKCFPIEVVQKMVERQCEQTGNCNVSVFQISKCSGNDCGFVWNKTIEGGDFWRDVIFFNNFDVFFEKYTTRTSCANPNCHYYIKKTSETKIDDIISKLVSLGGKSIYSDNKYYFGNDLYYIDPVSKSIIGYKDGTIIANLVTTFYTEVFVDEIYEYTMDEIAEKLGIDVKRLKIKK